MAKVVGIYSHHQHGTLRPFLSPPLICPHTPSSPQLSSAESPRQNTPPPAQLAKMDVAMALATLFFVVLLLASAAISLLLLRLCLAALRPSTTLYAAPDPEARPPPQDELHSLALPAPKPPKEQWAEPRRLAWREVEALTGGFDEAAVVGRGGSGNVVYGIRFDGSPAAVKVHRWCGGGERRLAAFRRELDLLRRVGRHPRLVALLAYSDDHGN